MTAPTRGDTIRREREDDAFDGFVRENLESLARLAYLLTGDHAAADDLAAEALLVVWSRWPDLLTKDQPLAYVRGIVVNLVAGRARSTMRERRRMRLFQAGLGHLSPDHDRAAILDVRSALAALPPRRRACVVLRFAFDLSEADVARTLGISVGTVKSQTSRGAAQLHTLLESGGVS